MTDEVAELKARVSDLETELKQLTSVLQMELAAPPPPPKHLQVRVVGGYSPQFIWSGFHTFAQLEKHLLLLLFPLNPPLKRRKSKNPVG